MGSKKNGQPTVKAWVAKDGDIPVGHLEQLQQIFDNRLEIRKGKHGQVEVIAENKDLDNLNEIMAVGGGDIFHQQSVYA